MYILIRVDADNDLAVVRDTSLEKTREVRIRKIADQIIANRIKIYGFRVIGAATQDCKLLPQYNLCVCFKDAYDALVEFLVSKGVPRDVAYNKVYGSVRR